MFVIKKKKKAKDAYMILPMAFLLVDEEFIRT
jgi:hypothetical protein